MALRSFPFSPRDLAEARAVLSDPALHQERLFLIQIAWDLLKEARGEPIPAARWDRLMPAHLSAPAAPARPAPTRMPRPLAAHFIHRMGLARPEGAA